MQSDINLKLIDDYKIDGDFIESQAFAFLAIRSILTLPISFPSTTGCIKPCIGGELIKIKLKPSFLSSIFNFSSELFFFILKK